MNDNRVLSIAERTQNQNPNSALTLFGSNAHHRVKVKIAPPQ
jgi:hypothetical protein